MRTIKSVIELGNSKAITLPLEISRKVKTGDKIVVDIRLVDLIENIVHYKCKRCQHEWDDRKDSEMVCPACDCKVKNGHSVTDGRIV